MSDGLIDNAVQVAAGGAGAGGSFFALRWLVQWFTGRLERREQLLDKQDERVDREWQKLREELKTDNDAMKQRLEQIAKQNEIIRFAFHHVTAALIRVDPRNPALTQVETLLAQAYPIDFNMLVTRAESALDANERAKLDD